MATFAGTSTAGGTVGVSSSSSVGTDAISTSATGTGPNAARGLYASSAGTDAIAAECTSSSHSGVWGDNSNGGYGVSGSANSSANGPAGVYATNGGNGYGLLAEAFGNASTGLAAYGTTYAGSFNGNVTVGGTLTKTAGTFLIDHPQDPAHKYLRHAFVESPDMKNIYDGVVVAGSNGEALVEMPGYFDALNSTYRYQLTPIGTPAPNLHIKAELSNGRFVIAGANPSQKISWQVTGVRKDAYAIAHPIVVEETKPPHEQGMFRHPEVHGEPASKGLATTPFSRHHGGSRSPK